MKATKRYRYRFARQVGDEAIAETLLLTSIATRSLHGAIRTDRVLRHRFDARRREFVIDADGTVGRDFSRILTGYLDSGFDRGSFIVEAIDGD